MLPLLLLSVLLLPLLLLLLLLRIDSGVALDATVAGIDTGTGTVGSADTTA
jgi:hypothetical protein